MVWSLPITAFRVPSAAVLERRLAYSRIVTAEVIEVLCFQAWTIVTVLIGWGVWGLASAVICRAVVGTIAMVVLSKERYIRPRFDLERAKRLLGFGLRVQGVELIFACRDQGINISAAALGGLSVLGLWSMAYRALQFPMQIFGSLFRVSFPAMSRMLGLGEDPKPILERALKLVPPACGLLLVPLAAASPALFPAVLGEKWSGAAQAIPPACLTLMLAFPVMLTAVSYLWAVGDGDTPLRGTIANTVTWFAISLPLLPVLGVLAIGLGMLGAHLVEVVILTKGVRKHVDVRFAYPIGTAAAIAVVATAPFWVLAWAEPPSLMVVAVSAVLAELAYVGGLAVFRRSVLLELGALGGSARRGCRESTASTASGHRSRIVMTTLRDCLTVIQHEERRLPCPTGR